MIEKIKKRKENNFSISYAEQHHRKKGKDKNKRKNNSFKNIEYMESNPLLDNYFTSSYDDIREIQERIFDGEEVKLFDVESVKKVLKTKKITNKIGSYQFDNDMILEILTYFDNKKVFLIRKG